jgi:hypothetical protein
MFTVETEITSLKSFTDDEGKEWFIINQDTWYPKDDFTENEARTDYLSEKSTADRYNSTYSTWCD